MTYPISCADLYPFFGPYRPAQFPLPLDPPQLSDKQILSQALKRAGQLLSKPECRKLFGDGFDPSAVIASLQKSGSFAAGNTQIRLFAFDFLGTDIFGGITYPSIVTASVGPLGLPVPVGVGADIFINTGIFKQVYPGAPAEAIRETADTIIEELGHAYNYATGSGGSSIVYDNPLFAGSYQWNGQTVSAGAYNVLQILDHCDK